MDRTAGHTSELQAPDGTPSPGFGVRNLAAPDPEYAPRLTGRSVPRGRVTQSLAIVLHAGTETLGWTRAPSGVPGVVGDDGGQPRLLVAPSGGLPFAAGRTWTWYDVAGSIRASIDAGDLADLFGVDEAGVAPPGSPVVRVRLRHPLSQGRVWWDVTTDGPPAEQPELWALDWPGLSTLETDPPELDPPAYLVRDETPTGADVRTY